MSSGGTDMVTDDEWLLRWIPVAQLVPGEFQVQSEMFRKPRFSVDRERLKSLERFKAENAPHHVARFLAGSCRQVGYEVTADPIDGNEAHAVVEASVSQNRLRQMARELRDNYVTLHRGAQISE